MGPIMRTKNPPPVVFSVDQEKLHQNLTKLEAWTWERIAFECDPDVVEHRKRLRPSQRAVR